MGPPCSPALLRSPPPTAAPRPLPAPWLMSLPPSRKLRRNLPSSIPPSTDGPLPPRSSAPAYLVPSPPSATSTPSDLPTTSPSRKSSASVRPRLPTAVSPSRHRRIPRCREFPSPLQRRHHRPRQHPPRPGPGNRSLLLRLPHRHYRHLRVQPCQHRLGDAQGGHHQEQGCRGNHLAFQAQ